MLMKIFVLLAIVACACAMDKNAYKEWKSHVAKYNRKFSNSQESRKSFENFAATYARVMETQRLYAVGLSTYNASLNHLSDLDFSSQLRNITGLIPADIFGGLETVVGKRSLAGYALSPLKYKVAVDVFVPGVDAALPASVDHSLHVGTIRDQQTCGSCYAHAAMKAIEMNIKIKSGKQFNLAPQQLVDCSHTTKSVFGNMGCDGGIIFNTLDFTNNKTLNLNCLALEADLPYQNKFISTRDCGANLCSTHNKVPFKVTGYEINQVGDIPAIKDMLRKRACFAQLHVNQKFMDYTGGIFQSTVTDQVNHAVVAVGYGKDATTGLEYIKILNSWGATWGEKGFIKVAMNSVRVTDLMACPIIEPR